MSLSISYKLIRLELKSTPLLYFIFRMTAGNFLRQPITWITALVNQFLLGNMEMAAAKSQSNVGKVQGLSVPEKDMNRFAFGQLDRICIENGNKINNYDAQLLDLLHQAIDANPFR